jgi:hypothetical protein
MGSGPQPGARIDESLPRNPVFVHLPGNPVSERFSKPHVLQVTRREGIERDAQETGFLSTDIPGARP